MTPAGAFFSQGMADHVAARQRTFDEACAKRLIRFCPNLSHIASWRDVAEEGEPYTPITVRRLDAKYRFPVRLVPKDLRAFKLDDADRGKFVLGFHELQPTDFLNPREFCRTQFFRAWQDAKDDGVDDDRPVAILFLCRRDVYVMHEAPSCGDTFIRVRVNPELVLTVQSLESLCETFR